MDASDIARVWRLEPHPEGGFYRETFRSQTTIELPGWSGERSLATAIIYMLEAGQRSATHRVRGDELWLWQGGAPMELTVGGARRLLGTDPDRNELQVLVPGGTWQSATPAGGEELWSLAACLVTPGFEFAEFELR